MDSVLPSLMCTVKLGAQTTPKLNKLQVYDVEFYPYTAPGVDAVFAVCAGARVIVARCLLKKDHAIEVIAWFEDKEGTKEESDRGHYNSLAWSQAENGDPLLCVTGGRYRQIRVFNVITKELVANLMAHGEDIMDIATSPIDPTILVTCSLDHSIRMWSLRPAHRKQPVVAILFGPNNKDPVLSIAYHRKGRFILAGDMDTKIAMWAVPEDLEDHIGTDEPKLIHYPHFSTNEIHTDFVDCVQWYNDLIISHASREDKLILWKIEDFNSDQTVVPDAPVPPSSAVRSNTPMTKLSTSGASTHSAWGGRFQRLLEFHLPYNQEWYTRFSIFHELDQPPILVAGNAKSKAFFWDLQRLERAGTGPPIGAPALPNHVREEGISSNASSSVTVGSNKSKGRRKQGKAADIDQGIGNPFCPVKAHSIITVPRYSDFTFRHFAWSRDGQWCIGVGDGGAIIVFHCDKP